METLRKQYVAPATVEIPVHGDGLMAVASPVKHVSERKNGINIGSAYSDDEVEEKVEYTFGGTGLD